MKKLILTTILTICSVAYANKKQPDGDPTGPPPSVIDELDGIESPEDLLDKIKDAESKAEKAEEDLAKLTKDHEQALKVLKIRQEEINSLTNQLTELQKLADEQAETLNMGTGSLFKGWVYSPELKWIYTSPTIAPYSYSQNDGWLLYKVGSDPRLVYYYETKEWVELKKKKPDNDKNGRK